MRRNLMFSFTAFNRTVILLFALLIMALAWVIGRMPGDSLPVIVFTTLTSALLVDVRPFRTRLLTAVNMACHASVIQLLLSASQTFPWLLTLFSIVLSFFTFSTFADYRAGCVVMLSGYLAISAPSGVLPVLGRSIDIFAGVIVIMLVTTLGHSNSNEEKRTVFPVCRYSLYQAVMLSAKLGIGTALAQILQLQQGAWIMLTIMFINMSKSPESAGRRLAFQRIFAVPAGIIAGGFLLGVFYNIDTRFIWLLPLIFASGFFVLYNYGDFFLFTVIFMISMTLFSDLAAGVYHRFNFWESFFSRSAATLLGALLELPKEPTGEAGISV